METVLWDVMGALLFLASSLAVGLATSWGAFALIERGSSRKRSEPPTTYGGGPTSF